MTAAKLTRSDTIALGHAVKAMMYCMYYVIPDLDPPLTPEQAAEEWARLRAAPCRVKAIARQAAHPAPQWARPNCRA